MKTLAEYFGFRPTKFLPNGCGSGITSKLVPDEVAGANFDACCDLHDLGYHVGKGGFLGLFYAKPVVDFKLMRCMDQQFNVRVIRLGLDGRRMRAFTTFLASVFVPPIYFIALTLIVWTPLTCPWKESPMPSHEDLERLLAHNQED